MRSLLDDIMANFRRYPFRCRACSRRFYRYVPREETPETGGKAQAASAENSAGNQERR